MEDRMYSINGEDFNYTQIDYAVEDVFYDKEVAVGATITVYEGTVVNFKAGKFAPSFVLDELNSAACDDCGDDAVGEWPDCEKAVEVDLEEMVAAAIDAWADRHNLQPTFGGIENVKELSVRKLSDDGNFEVV